MAIDHRFIAQRIVIKLIVSSDRESNSQPIVAKQSVVEQYAAEYAQKYNFALDKDRLERELKKYGVKIEPEE